MPKKKDLSQRLEAVIKTLIPQYGQNADDLGPMMRAIKAVHSATDHTSTTPEDLEHQRAAQELFARLVTPVHRHPQRRPQCQQHSRRVGQSGAWP